MNALRDEAKSRVIEPGLPVLGKLRLAPTVFDVLKAEMNDRETWGEFCTEAMLFLASTRRMVRSDVRGNIALLVRVVGSSPHDSGTDHTDVGEQHDRRKPLGKATAR